MSYPQDSAADESQGREATPDLVAYEDDGALVMCERSNPNAWIRSTVTVSATDTEATTAERADADQTDATDNPRTRNFPDR